MATKPSAHLLFCRELFICFNAPICPILQNALALFQEENAKPLKFNSSCRNSKNKETLHIL